MTLTPKAMDSNKSTQDVKPAAEVFEFQGNPAFVNLVENFCFIKEEDIVFALEVSSDSVNDLFRKKIKEKIQYGTRNVTKVGSDCNCNPSILQYQEQKRVIFNKSTLFLLYEN